MPDPPQFISQWAAIAQRMVHNVDLMFGLLQKFRLGQILEAGVTRHRKIRTIELQHEAGIDNGFVLDPHCLAYSLDIRRM